jgi:hypothetical protein
MLHVRTKEIITVDMSSFSVVNLISAENYSDKALFLNFGKISIQEQLIYFYFTIMCNHTRF